MPIRGHPVAGPDRVRTEVMDHPLATSTERLRDHLRRPHAGQRNNLTKGAAYTVDLSDGPSDKAVIEFAARVSATKIPIAPGFSCVSDVGAATDN